MYVTLTGLGAIGSKDGISCKNETEIHVWYIIYIVFNVYDNNYINTWYMICIIW